MKIKPTLLGLALISMAVFFLGCSTPGNSTIDWQSRVGTYTYTQAVADMGKPAQWKQLPDGGASAEWITHRAVGNYNSANPDAMGLGNGYRAGGVDQPIAPTTATASTPKSEYLRLNFDPSGKLTGFESLNR